MNKMDLAKVSIDDLLKELDKRKKKTVPTLVKRINDDIKALEQLGVKIYDAGDDDYRLDEVLLKENGDLEFKTVERWDD